jgi:hypothetical protein
MPLLPAWLVQLPILGLLAVRLVGQETESWGLRTRLDFSTVATLVKSVMSGSSGVVGALKDTGMYGMIWDIGTLQEHDLQEGEQLVARCVKGRPKTVGYLPRSLGGRVYRETTGTEVGLLAPEEHSEMFLLATRRYPTFLGMNALAAQLSRYRFRVHREARNLDPAASLHVPVSVGKVLGWIAFFGLVVWLFFAAS